MVANSTKIGRKFTDGKLGGNTALKVVRKFNQNWSQIRGWIGGENSIGIWAQNSTNIFQQQQVPPTKTRVRIRICNQMQPNVKSK